MGRDTLRRYVHSIARAVLYFDEEVALHVALFTWEHTRTSLPLCFARARGIQLPENLPLLQTNDDGFSPFNQETETQDERKRVEWKQALAVYLALPPSQRHRRHHVPSEAIALVDSLIAVGAWQFALATLPATPTYQRIVLASIKRP